MKLYVVNVLSAVAFVCVSSLVGPRYAFGAEAGAMPDAAPSSTATPIFSPSSLYDRLGFGLGISYTHDLGDHDRILIQDDVFLDANGLVRLKEDNNSIPRFILETHVFFEPDWFGPNQGDWKVDPFVAVQPGTDELISAIGMGVMVGFKTTKPQDETSSWNFGLGVMVDPKVRILDDGIEEGSPLPANETYARTKVTDQWGLLLMTSYGF